MKKIIDSLQKTVIGNAKACMKDWGKIIRNTKEIQKKYKRNKETWKNNV